MIRRPNRTGDPARRGMGRGPVRSRPTRTGDGPKRTLPTGVRRIGRRATPEQRAKLKQAAELFRRRRAAGVGRRRPTQRMTAQQRARLAAQARSRGSRGRNLGRRIRGAMGRRTLRRR